MVDVKREMGAQEQPDDEDNEEGQYTEVVYLDEQYVDAVENEEQTNEEDEEELFYCSTCDVNITSVEQHIQECHYGENIVVEVVPLW